MEPLYTLLDCRCKIGNDNIIRRYNYFHYNRLRKSFQFRLLERLKEYFGDSPKYKIALNRSYRNNSKGFYVYAPPLKVRSFNKAKEPVKELVGYITRYDAHPPIAESRITNVDYDEDTVTFFYEPHEDDQKESKDKVGKVEVTLSSNELIGLLIQHIPDFNFHNIRYYGFMSHASKIDTSNVRKLYPKIHINILIINLKYLYRFYECYKYDSLLCECGEYMVFNKELSYFVATIMKAYDVKDGRYIVCN